MSLFKRSGDEQGIAMITVILVGVVIMILGSGMYLLMTRESNIAYSDHVGGQAFYFAEGGLENVIDILNYEVTESQLTRRMPDQSSDGSGYLMNPDPNLRQNPPVEDRIHMRIADQYFNVWVDEVDANGNHCVNCGVNLSGSNPAYLLITAEGQAPGGYRKVQQQVKVQASDFPRTLFIDGDVTANGNVTVTNQKIFVRGSFYGREKITVGGPDSVYGGQSAVLATGSIYAKPNGLGSQIYTVGGLHSLLYWNQNYVYDRDSRGPTGNTFSIGELQNTFSTGGLSTSQLQTLKGMAKASGYYSNPVSGNITLLQSNIPNHEGNTVVYIEFSGGSPNSNLADLKFEWPHSPYTSGQAWVIVRNGSVKMTGNQIGNFHGSVYCPDGPVSVDGSGSGTYTGTVWGKGLKDIGNFSFVMNSNYFDDPPFFTWTVVRQTDWTEVDG